MKAALVIFAVGALTSTTLHAQDIAGTWQGTLQGADAAQYILKIAKSDASGLRASIARRGSSLSLPVEHMTFEGSTLKFSVQLFDSSYEGTLSADSNYVVGRWTHDRRVQPLTFVRVTPETAWEMRKTPVTLRPMAGEAHPEFDVATIKPSGPEAGYMDVGYAGRRLRARNATLADLMLFAYGIHAQQILDMPAAMEKAKYDIDAEYDVEDGAPSTEQRRQMLQKLLADRFKLVVHHDTKEFPIYALTVGRGGAKLVKSQEDPNDPPHYFQKPETGGEWTTIETNVTMSDFVRSLMTVLAPDRLIVDQTNLQGKFDIRFNALLDITPSSGTGGGAPAPSDQGVALHPFEAIEEQLGLELKSTKAPVDVLIVDHVEKPSPN